MAFVTPEKGAVIYLIDDDERVVEALSELIESLGREVVSFATAKEYLDHNRTDAAPCLIVDIKLPGMSGLDLQSKLSRDLILLSFSSLVTPTFLPLCEQ